MSKYQLGQIIRADDPKQWAEHLSGLVGSLILTSRLALENDGSGICSDEQRAYAVAKCLEAAEALNDIVIDGAEGLERAAGISLMSKREGAA